MPNRVAAGNGGRLGIAAMDEADFVQGVFIADEEQRADGAIDWGVREGSHSGVATVILP